MMQKKPVDSLFVAGVVSLFLQTLWYVTAHHLVNLGWWGRGNLKEVAGICCATAVMCILVLIWKRDASIKYLALLGLIVLAALAGLPAVTALLLLLSATLSIGDLILKRRSPDYLWSDISLAICVGLVVILTAVSVSVHWRINYPFIYFLALLATCLANIRGLGWHARAMHSRLCDARLHTRFDYVAVVACASLLSLLVFFALMPTVNYDALVTHLWLPEYVRIHGIATFDYQSYVWTLMPLGCDWLYTVALMLGGEKTAKLLDLLLVCLGCIMVAGVYVRHTTERTESFRIGIIIFLFLMSSAIGINESISLYVDNLLLVLYAAVILLLADPPDLMGWRWTVSLGLLLGGAIACKMMGILFAGLCGLAVLIILLRNKGAKAAFQLSWPGLVALLAAGLIPYVYAWSKTGNPVFPFFNAIFASPYYPRVNFQDSRWVDNLYPSLLFDSTFKTNRFIEGSPGGLGFQYWVFLPFALIWVVWHRYRQAVLPLAVALFYIIGILVNEQYLRYLYPIFPLLLLAIAWFVVDVARRGRLAFCAIWFCCACVIVLNMSALPSFYELSSGVNPRVALLDKNRTNFIETYSPIRALTKRVNSDFGEAAHVLLLTDEVGAVGLKGTVLYKNFYNPQLQDQLSHVNSEDDILNIMQMYSVTHVIFSPGSTIPNKQQFVAFLAKYATLTTSMAGDYLYELNVPSIFTHTLLQNGSFKNGLNGWAVWTGTVGTTEAGETLAEQTVIGQNVQLGQSDNYYLSATVSCQGQEGSFHIMVEWRDLKGKTVGTYDEPHYCVDIQEHSFNDVIYAPTDAQNANVVVGNYTPHPVSVSSVLFQSGGLPRMSSTLRP